MTSERVASEEPRLSGHRRAQSRLIAAQEMCVNRKFVVSWHQYKGFYFCAECGALSIQWLGVLIEFNYGGIV